MFRYRDGGATSRRYRSLSQTSPTRARCSLLRSDPAQSARLEEIRDNLEACVIEAKREKKVGSAMSRGLQVSYSGVKRQARQDRDNASKWTRCNSARYANIHVTCGTNNIHAAAELGAISETLRGDDQVNTP
jgi:hypothetical protein